MAQSVDPGSGGRPLPPPPPPQWTPNSPYTVTRGTPTFTDPVSYPGERTMIPIPGVIDPNSPDPYAVAPPPPPIGGDTFEVLPPPPPLPPVDPYIPPPDFRQARPPSGPILPPQPPPPPTPYPGPVTPNFSSRGGRGMPSGGGSFGPRSPMSSNFRPQIPLWARGLQRSGYEQFRARSAQNPFMFSGGFQGFQPDAPFEEDPDEMRRRQEAAMMAGEAPAWTGIV